MSAIQFDTQVSKSNWTSMPKAAWQWGAQKVQALWDAIKVCWIIFTQWLSFSEYEIKELDLSNVSQEMQQKLKDFERKFDYPLGEGKRFRILHGKGDSDYFGFVRRMGKPVFYVAINKKERTVTREILVNGHKEKSQITLKAGEIAGVGAAVLRDFGKGNKAWYLCDLKVKDEYRGEHIPIRLFQKGMKHYFRCSKGYAICMNPGDGSLPRAAHIWQRHGWISSKHLALNLYNLQAEDFLDSYAQIEKACGGPVTFKSMKGIKEFEIFGEHEAAREWKMLHIQHGPMKEQELEAPRLGHDHLIAAVEGTPLDCALQGIKNIQKFSSATIVYRGLDPAVFENTILTNEI